ncbi:MAG: YeeE/YedE family protein [Burkholderiaceae bacterium]
MSIDWSAYTPTASLVGGLLIGLASGLYLLGNGRVAGIAGIVGGAWRALLGGAGFRNQGVRGLFLIGMAVAPWLWRLAAPLPAAPVDVGWVALIAAGLLVGVGVRMGNGCTSGHGVCGLSRLSLRSLVNVLAFIGAGVATVTVLRHVL